MKRKSAFAFLRQERQSNIDALRETLADIAKPGKWFKVDVRSNHILVRLNYRDRGGREVTERSAKFVLDVLNDAVQMPRDQFRSRVERSLRRGGFEI